MVTKVMEIEWYGMVPKKKIAVSKGVCGASGCLASILGSLLGSGFRALGVSEALARLGSGSNVVDFVPHFCHGVKLQESTLLDFMDVVNNLLANASLVFFAGRLVLGDVHHDDFSVLFAPWVLVSKGPPLRHNVVVVDFSHIVLGSFFFDCLGLGIA